MRKKTYNLLSIIILIILFCATFKFAHAQELPQTLINYPTIASQSVVFGISLPNLIKYIYLFAVGICGAIALAAILLGAIKYVGAAGNPSKMADAKEQIFSAVLGVIILLSSYLILYTINPDLVKIGMTLPTFDTSYIHSATDVYRCFCQCERTVRIAGAGGTIIQTYTVALDGRRLGSAGFNRWGTTECKTEAAFPSWQSCRDTCEATAEHMDLGTGCSKLRANHEETIVFKNNSIQAAWQHEPYYPSSSDTSCGTWRNQ